MPAVKRAILMLESAADFPFPELRDQTPMETARAPHARAFAKEGVSGTLKFSAAESSHAMSFLCEACGLSRAQARRVRWGPLAAGSLGWPPDSSRFRALGHFVTCAEDEITGPAFPDSAAEQDALLEEIQARLCAELGGEYRLAAFGKGRFVLDGPLGGVDMGASLTPTELAGKSVARLHRRLPGELSRVLALAGEILETHAVNQVRLDLGQNPLNGVWLWSGGSLSGVSRSDVAPGRCLLSPDPLALSLGGALGLPCLAMDNPYTRKDVDAAFDVGAFLDLFGRCGEAVVWIPSPFSRDEVEGPEEKVRRLDAVDYYVTGPARAVLDDRGPGRALLLSAGVRHRGRPEKGRAPFVLWGEGIEADSTLAWTEREGLDGSLGTPKFSTLLDLLRN